MDVNLIGFDVFLGQKKPENLVNTSAPCPFCDVKHLTDIIAVEGDIILLKNKYNVITEADQFVIIESGCHDKDMPDYSKEYMRKLMCFSINHWQNFIESKKYEAVLFFKNFGPMSGGTISHPHMQIVGFPKINNKFLFDEQEFKGIEIIKKEGVVFNGSTCPKIGFGELNLIVEKSNYNIDVLSDFIKIAVDYLMNHFNKRITSYNIFFYYNSEKIFVKIMPRFATSPLFVGYNIRFLPNNMNMIVDEIKKLYF